MYPRDTKEPARPGRLRLLYEANPMAMLIEQAAARRPPAADGSWRSGRPSCTSGCR